jgi:hypothetical protein
MRFLGAVLGIVLGIGALAGTIWIARYAPWVEPTVPHLPLGAQRNLAPAGTPPPAAPADDKKDTKGRPTPADKPPFPKAVTGQRVFDFGSMAVNEEQKHKFAISNEGKGALLLEVGPSSCKCTVGSLAKNKVLPGETVDVELTWHAKEVAANFAQQATIWTSDPDSPDIQFKVYGKVDNKYQVIPEKVWHAGHVTDVQEGTTTAQIDVTGSRSGPMLFLPPIGKGLWQAEKARLNLGRVRREVGSVVKLPAIIYGIKDKFNVLKTTTDAEYLKVSIEDNPEIAQGEQQGIRFVFELPPGSPAVTRVNPNGVHVTLKTNHPKLEEINFEVEFICQ